MGKKFAALLLTLFLAISVMNTAELSLGIKLAKDVKLTEGAYDEYVADAEKQQIRLVLTTDAPVTNFKVLGLEIKEVDNTGKPFFSEAVLYTQEKLTPKRPLVLTLSFLGDIPNYGISYTDENGAIKRYAIGQSGEDGSLLLTEYSAVGGR